ncbi:MAG: hypothetical protein SF002_14250 [Alphaproteobacteria bacterium]|nr:hypothetical protein [Alphaproteobacteria bacterium]
MTPASQPAAFGTEPRRRTLNLLGQEFLSNLFRDWRWVLAGFCLPVMLGVMAASRQTPIYEAEARLLILPSTDYIFRSEIGEAGVGSALDRDQIVAAEIEIIGQAEAKRQVIGEIGLGQLYPGLPPGALDEAVRRFEGQLTFNTTFEASSIRISFRHPDEALAERALALLIQKYLERRRAVFRPPQTDFIERQAEEFERRLAAADEALRSFQQRTRLWSIETQTITLLRQRAEAEELLQQIDQQVRQSEAQLQAFNRAIATMPRQVDAFVEQSERPDVEGARATLVTLEVRRQDLLTRFTEESAFVQDLDRQIASLKEFIDRTALRRQELRATQINSVRDDFVQRQVSLTAAQEGLQAQRSAVLVTIQALNQTLAEVIGNTNDHDRLARERQILEESQQFYARKLEEFSAIAEREARREANIRLTQPPAVPARPTDRRPLIIIGAVLVGMLVGVSVALVRAGLRQRFLTADEVERHYDLPVLLAVDDFRRLPPRLSVGVAPTR